MVERQRPMRRVVLDLKHGAPPTGRAMHPGGGQHPRVAVRVPVDSVGIVRNSDFGH